MTDQPLSTCTDCEIKIARVFPRRTVASPTDSLAFFDVPPTLALPDIDVVHVSVTFTWDLRKAEWLAKQWRSVGVPVEVGGPALNGAGSDFVPGRYLKNGYVITSRGCPNKCWFCSVPKREGGKLKELPITDGWNVLDDNFLACSDQHIRNVFAMLQRQPERPIFTGGLEAKLLKPWHVDLLRVVKTKRLYCAYDTRDDLEPLIAAGKMLRAGGITRQSHVASCYVLIGYHGDTFDKAESRLTETLQAGFMPYAMLYRDETGRVDQEWKRFQREWLRHQIVAAKMSRLVTARTAAGPAS